MKKLAYNIAEFAEMYSQNEQTVRVNVSRNPDLVPKVMRVGRAIFFTAEAIKAWEVEMHK
tara:strand:- start:3974 stop:4153 length:180 start_codon:yes stop_codon:yes gene_type:complete